MWLSETAKANGLAIDLKNSVGLLIDEDTGDASQYQAALVKAFDFVVIESCVGRWFPSDV
jgi:hypothetical protein